MLPAPAAEGMVRYLNTLHHRSTPALGLHLEAGSAAV